MKFYLAREGVAFGPYTEFQVRESVRLGIFESGDLALAEDGKDWSTVAQLLPAAREIPLGPEQSKSASAPVEVSTVEAVLPSGGISWLTWRMAWAAPVVIGLCGIGVWSILRQRPSTPRPASTQAAAVIAPVKVVQPEPALRPPTDDMALPTRENIAATSPQASTVANPLVPPGDSPQKAPPTEEVPKLPEPQHSIVGQINIAAKNGRTYEPSAVEVRLYPIAMLKPHLEKRGLEANAKYDELGERMKAADAEKETLRKVSDAAFDAYSASDREAPNRHELEVASDDARKAREKAANDFHDLRQQREDILSGAFYLDDLPPATSVTRTDSEGKFRLTAPEDGEYAVVAGTQRGGEGVERYYWFVPVNLLGESNKSVLLSNNNTTAHGSTDSLVQTVD